MQPHRADATVRAQIAMLDCAQTPSLLKCPKCCEWIRLRSRQVEPVLHGVPSECSPSSFKEGIEHTCYPTNITLHVSATGA